MELETGVICPQWMPGSKHRLSDEQLFLTTALLLYPLDYNAYIIEMENARAFIPSALVLQRTRLSSSGFPAL